MLGVSFSITVGPYKGSAGISLEPHPGFSAHADLKSGLSVSVKALLVHLSFAVGEAS